MRIVPLASDHVSAVAALHSASLSGLLTQLGPPAVRSYYAACVALPSVCAFVALEGERVQGFVLGSLAPATLSRRVAARRPFGIAAALALGVLRNPALAWWMLRSNRGPDLGTYDRNAPELTYLAVQESDRTAGVGRQLVTAFANALCGAGARRCELSVDEGNGSAIAFYRRMGFVEVGRYREFGLWHLRYALELDNPRAASALREASS